MIKIVVLVLIILMAFDGIYRDGVMVKEFLSTEFYIPFFVKVFLFIIAAACSLLLLHAVIWEYFLQPKPEIVKTEYQLKKEQEAKEEEERLEQERLEAEELRKQEENEKTEKERVYIRENPQPDYLQRKKSKLG